MSRILAGFMVLVFVILFLGWLTLFVASLDRTPRFYVEYGQPQNEDEVAAMRLIQDSKIGHGIFGMLEEGTAVCENTVIVYGAPDGPLYTPDARQIWFPYSFFVDVYSRFVANQYGDTDEERIERTIDVAEYVLIHEIGHALVHQLQLPVVGREEDAVDTFATLVLIDYYENGADIVLSAADFWGFLRLERPELAESDFADEHSLDAQRFHQTLCLIYGSDPVRYRKIAEMFQMDDRRAHMCVREYEQKREAWGRLIEQAEAVRCEQPLQ